MGESVVGFWPRSNCVEVSLGKIMNHKLIPEEQSSCLGVRVNNKQEALNMIVSSTTLSKSECVLQDFQESVVKKKTIVNCKSIKFLF